MNATRTPRLGFLLSLALALALGPATTGFSQATQPKPGMAPKAKEKGKAKAAEAAGPVDLNSATAEELMTLPGIGEASARKIIDARPHKSVADLATAGIPGATIEKIRPLAVANPLPEPVAVNLADLKAIEALPGVGPALAREIIAGRPYASYDDLARLKGVGPAKIEALRGRLKFETAEVAEAKEKVASAAAKAKEKISSAAAAAKEKMAGEPKKAAAPSTGLVNLNKASKEELDALPGIGPVRAQQIIDARPFGSIEDIMKIKGIKEVEFGKIKDMITVK